MCLSVRVLHYKSYKSEVSSRVTSYLEVSHIGYSMGVQSGVYNLTF